VIAAGGFVSIENGIKRGDGLAVSRITGEHKNARAPNRSSCGQGFLDDTV